MASSVGYFVLLGGKCENLLNFGEQTTVSLNTIRQNTEHVISGWGGGGGELSQCKKYRKKISKCYLEFHCLKLAVTF